jgi:hypothetical protein
MSIARALSKFWLSGRGLSSIPLVVGVALLAGCARPDAQQESTTGRNTKPTDSEASIAADPAADGAEPTGDGATSEDDTPVKNSTSSSTVESPAAVNSQLQEDLIQSVVDSLNRLDEYDPSQILPQLRDRLNQWTLQSRRSATWQLDPLLANLNPALTSAPAVQQMVKNLDTGIFTMNDMVGLQEAIWLRDIAKHARGSQLDDLSVAEQLFDWTVRNIQLVEDPAPGESAAQHSPAEILLLGRGTARERAWIFLLLLRQQGLDGVMLAIPGAEGSPPREWLPALVTETDLVLFDTWLGIPLPGADGKHVATLAEVAQNDELLRKLDLSADRPYPVKAEQLAHVIAYVEASPLYLSRRMETLDGRLTGDHRVVLAARPGQLAERLKGRANIDQVQCWPLAYEFLQTRSQLPPGQPPPSVAELIAFQAVEPLGKARILQFKGQVDGPRGAMAYYLKARVPKSALAKMPAEQQRVLEIAKQDASYWLGLIAFEQQKFPVAIDFFSRRTLAASPDGPWTDGAHYNLARSYEASRQLPAAIDLYQSDSSPQKHGNRLRARRLKAEATASQTAEETKP